MLGTSFDAQTFLGSSAGGRTGRAKEVFHGKAATQQSTTGGNDEGIGIQDAKDPS
jgi:anthranilate/para-aminobenzoate synthase component II